MPDPAYAYKVRGKQSLGNKHTLSLSSTEMSYHQIRPSRQDILPGSRDFVHYVPDLDPVARHETCTVQHATESKNLDYMHDVSQLLKLYDVEINSDCLKKLTVTQLLKRNIRLKWHPKIDIFTNTF